MINFIFKTPYVGNQYIGYQVASNTVILAYLVNYALEAIVDGNIDENADYEDIEQIGWLELDYDSEANLWLRAIQVAENFRRLYIASTLIEIAVLELDLNCIPGVKAHPAYAYSLSPLGESLIAGCLRKGIIEPGMCYFSLLSNHQSLDTILNQNYEDPGLDSTTVLDACHDYRPKPQVILTYRPVASFFDPNSDAQQRISKTILTPRFYQPKRPHDIIRRFRQPSVYVITMTP